MQRNKSIIMSKSINQSINESSRQSCICYSPKTKTMAFTSHTHHLQSCLRTSSSLALRVWSLLLSLLLDHFAQVLVNLSEHIISPLPHRRLGGAQVASNIADEVFLLARGSPQYFPQLARLDEIFLFDG